MTTAYVGLGSNLGDRTANLSAAIEALDWGGIHVRARSSVYETQPVGGPPDQPVFHNQVIAVETTLSAGELFERCQAVEAALGRERESAVRWGPRTIDVDLLLYSSEVVDEPDLQIPHARMHERAFVLVPLAEIAPDVVVPGHGRARDLAAAVPAGGVRVA